MALADPRAESPPESRPRLRLQRAGLPAPDVQYEVADEYGFVLARCDLAYPHARVALEYDGAVHVDRRRRLRDMQRDAELAGHGWLNLRFGRDDVDSAQAVERVRAALRHRAEIILTQPRGQVRPA